MSESVDHPPRPKAIRHQQILEVAAEQPEASLDTIAAKVPCATPELVERILNEYGDPAKNHAEPSPEPSESSVPDEPGPPDPSELTKKQREVLYAIYEHPTLTQDELADTLGVCSATISNRANSIPGFTWTDRHAFANAVFTANSPADPDPESEPQSEPQPEPESSPMSQHQADSKTNAELTERITAIEHQLETLTNRDEPNPVFEDPALAHKVAHACLQADTITQDEELHIFKALLQ